MQKRTEKVKDEQRGGEKKEVSREERSIGTLSNTETLQLLTDDISYAAFQFCRKVGNSGFKLGHTLPKRNLNQAGKSDVTCFLP